MLIFKLLNALHVARMDCFLVRNANVIDLRIQKNFYFSGGVGAIQLQSRGGPINYTIAKTNV